MIEEIVKHLLGETHIVFVVSIDSIVFATGELLDMTWVRSFITKLFADLEDFLEHTHGCDFLGTFEGDPEIHVLVEVVMMRRERTSSSTRGSIGEDRCLELDKSRLMIEISQGLGKHASELHSLEGLTIENHIQISLSIGFLLVVTDTMKLITEWSDGLGQELILGHKQCEFSFVRHEEFATDTDEVTNIEHFVDESVVEGFSFPLSKGDRGGSFAITIISPYPSFQEGGKLTRLMFEHDLYLS